MDRVVAAFLLLAVICLPGCDSVPASGDDAGASAGAPAPKQPAPLRDPFVGSGDYRSLKGQ